MGLPGLWGRKRYVSDTWIICSVTIGVTGEASSGGGSINIFCNQFSYSSESSITAKGGVSPISTKGLSRGGAGGGGYISIGSILHIIEMVGFLTDYAIYDII